MPARSPHLPKYRHYKPKDLAVVRIRGKDHYLGKYGSEASQEKYRRLIAELLTAPEPSPTRGRSVPGSASSLTLDDLLVAYWNRHVVTYYVKAGRPTSEQDNIRQALRFLRRTHGSTPAAEFGPLALRAVRQAMIEAGRSRRLINKDVNRIRQLFGWAVEHELLPVGVHQALQRVQGLRKGRSAAREAPPVAPVPEEAVLAVLPHLSPQVAAMVQLQLLTGCRPQEVVAIRPGEVETGGAVWTYRPLTHKTEHLGRGKVILLGPRAQEVLKPWLDRDPEFCCFVPAETSAWSRGQRRRRPEATRPQKGAGRPKRTPGPKYTRHSYRVAIQRACRRAGVAVWTPLQLRHTRATRIREAYGLEAAKAVLGHADTKITEIYAERDLALAIRVMREIG